MPHAWNSLIAYLSNITKENYCSIVTDYSQLNACDILIGRVAELGLRIAVTGRFLDDIGPGISPTTTKHPKCKGIWGLYMK